MNELGGPVWHASISMLPGWPADERFLQQCALEALQGVGDADRGEWMEWTGTYFHIRRRLRRKEQQSIGEARDIRGTEEAVRRRAAVQRYLPVEMRDWKE